MAQSSVAASAVPTSTPSVRRLAWLQPVAGLLAISSALLAVYIANSPHLDRFNDSGAYQAVADGLPRSFISSTRMPGYPVLIALSTWLAGGHDAGLIAAQALLIVAAVAATYFIARSALGHGWMAFVVALVVAGDVLIAGYVRVEMTETLAVFLASMVFLAVLRYLRDFEPRYAWISAGIVVALMLVRPEWAFLPLALLPYVGVIAWRRGRLGKRMLVHAIGGAAAVLLAVGAYCTANLAVNGYFGLTSVTNIALLGKVMVYGMVDEAPGRYAALIPTVESSSSAWELVTAPPFNDRNAALAGEFARAAIFHDPLRFAQDVMGTAITSGGEHDSQFLRIDASGPFAHWLKLLVTVDQTRYRAFVILPALALAWMLAALAARRPDYRMQALGVLGLIVLYDWVLTAAATYGEFERLRMPINPIATLIVLGTFLLLLRLAAKDRGRMVPVAALIAFEAAAIAFLPRITNTALSELALLAIAAVHVVVFVRWSRSLTADQAGV